MKGVKLTIPRQDLSDGLQCACGDRRPASHIGHGQNVLLDLRREAEHSHDLGHSRSSNPLTACDGRLIGNLAGLEERLPFDGLPEQLDHVGRPGSPGWFGLVSARSDGAHDPLRGHPARQGANVAVLERPLRPQRDLDRLFAVGGPGGAVWAARGDVDDPEPDLGLGHAMGSNTVTLGEPFVTGFDPATVW